MAKMHRLDRRGSGPWFYVAIVLLTYFLYSLTLAVSTADDCGEGMGRKWSYWPPQWECTRPAGYLG